MERIRRENRLERNGFMNNYSEKDGGGQGSANQGAGYLIRNGRTAEECYLKSVMKDRVRDPLLEAGFDWKKTKRRKRRPEKKQEELPDTCATAIWTMDETQALYFGSRAEAQELIDGWNVLKLARAVVIQG